jgi:hypothetical protein
MAQSIILKRSALQGKVPTTSSLSLGEIAINTYDGKLYLNRSGSTQSIQEIITTNVVNTGSITLTQTGSFAELVVSQDGNFKRDVYVTRDIITNGSLDILYDVTASAFLGTIRARNGVISGSSQVNFTQISGISAGIVSSSAQLIPLLPAGTISGSSAGIISSSAQLSALGYATTGSNSFKADQQITGSLGVSGDITVLGSVNARQFNIGIISSSVIYQSGSTKFGDTGDDIMSVTGSLNVSGSLNVAGNILPSPTTTYTLGSATNQFSQIWCNTGILNNLYTTAVRASGTNILFGSNITNYWGGFIGTSPTSSANFILNYTPSAGLGGDNGYKLQIYPSGSASGSLFVSGSSVFSGSVDISGSLTTTGVSYIRTSASAAPFMSIGINAGLYPALTAYNSSGINKSQWINANGSMYFDYDGVGGGNLNFRRQIDQDSTTVARFVANGNLLLQNGGTFTDNGYKLQISGSSTGSLYVTGSSLFNGNIQQLGSQTITGSVTATSFTGSLFGTASYALNGSSNAIMYQTASAASTWVFNHFLATPYPVVTVYDNNNSVIIPQSIVSNDSSSLTITFSSARTGVAVASKGGYVGSSVGTATTATALLTARLINGTSFDGTQNITIPNLVSGSTQISLAGTSDYSSLFGGIASATASLNTFTSSINGWSGSVATTGSNTFRGNQTITGSVNTSGSLVVIGEITGSNIRATSGFAGTLFGSVSGWLSLGSNGGEVVINTTQFRYDKNVTIVWGGSSGVNSIRDLGLRRNNTGSLEIYDGVTADGAVANRRDLILRDITGSNAFFSGSSTITGSLGVSGSITANTFIGSIAATNGVVSGSSQVIGILSSLNTFSASQESKDSTLGTYTGSIDAKFVSIGASTSSLNTYTASTDTRFSALQASTASLNIYTQSNDTLNTTQNSRLTALETATGSNTSVSQSIYYINNYTGSAFLSQSVVNNRLSALEIASSSLEFFTSSQNTKNTTLATYTGSVDTKWANLAVYTASVDTKFAAVQSTTNSLNLFTSSILTALTSSGVNLTANGSLTVQGNLIISGTTTTINSQTLNIGDNIIELNYGGTAVRSGIYTKDATGASLISGSFLWDATNDYWIAGISGSEQRILVVGSMGVVSGSGQISIAGTSDYSGLFGGIGASTASLNVFSASVNGHIVDINSKTGSFETKFVTLGIVSGSLNQFTSSINSWSGSIATTGSNIFRGNQTITGSLQVTGSLTVNGLTTLSGSLTLSPSQSAFLVSHSISQSAIVGATVYGVNITPLFTNVTSSQTQTALRVMPTFTGSFSGSNTANIIADFGATSVGSQFTITDTVSGSIYMVNDVSGLPIIEALSDGQVNMYDFPYKAFNKSGSYLSLGTSLTPSSSVTVQSDFVVNKGYGLYSRTTQASGSTVSNVTSSLFNLVFSNVSSSVFMSAVVTGYDTGSRQTVTGDIKSTIKYNAGVASVVGYNQKFINSEVSNVNFDILASSTSASLLVYGSGSTTYKWGATITYQVI